MQREPDRFDAIDRSKTEQDIDPALRIERTLMLRRLALDLEDAVSERANLPQGR